MISEGPAEVIRQPEATGARIGDEDVPQIPYLDPPSNSLDSLGFLLPLFPTIPTCFEIDHTEMAVLVTGFFFPETRSDVYAYLLPLISMYVISTERHRSIG